MTKLEQIINLQDVMTKKISAYDWQKQLNFKDYMKKKT